MMKILLLGLLQLFSFQTHTYQSITCEEKIAEPRNVHLYWKDRLGLPLRSMSALFRHDPKVTYATNAGMYDTNYSPLGLYVENGKQLRPVKRIKSEQVNFGMKPQGVFLITKDYKAKVTDIDDPLLKTSNILYATQSSPLLVRSGRVSPTLSRSTSAKIRNAVGVLKNGQLLFAVTNEPCTFQQFAQYLADKGCTDAMMLDGVVSCSATKKTKDFCNVDYGPMIGIY